ncbi:MAG: hypothetical protein CMJ75_22910 [Planctomycetaceae bacterium]|nr:hypothetical protein [Planctomycetaceae bacterium]
MEIPTLICVVALLAPVHNAQTICEASQEIDRIAWEQSIPWEVLIAQGIHESRWTTTAINPKTGALGVFQQMPQWSPIGRQDLLTLQGSLDGLTHTLNWIRKWPRAGGSIPSILCVYGSGKSQWCEAQGLRGSQYSRTVERLAGPLVLLSRMLDPYPESLHF